MAVLALDIGERRIGVAVSDAAGAVAMPLTVLDTAAARADGTLLGRILADHEVDRIVVGLPLTLEGAEGPQARRVRSLAERVTRDAGIAVDYIDERLSSAEAKRRMRESGGTERSMRGSIDKVAAAILLQTYLDEHR